MSNDGLLKIHVSLPHHWAVGGESFWAKPLGHDLDEVQNVPFYAYGLNFLDVARAPPDDEGVLEIRSRERASGRRTIRVLFNQTVPKKDRLLLLRGLEQWGATMENADSTLFAIDLKPEGDLDAVMDRLDRWADEDLLGLETCEARVESSFDDFAPNEDE